jgi:hypothetical protein
VIGRLREIQVRRMVLVERSTAERAAIAAAASTFTRKLAAVDRIAASVRAHPFLAIAAAGAVALAGRSRLINWVLRGATVYSLLRRI